ncbi:MAG: MmcQ/YjbR family DNA-binding protein [Blautia sp.]|nr:MmcQ/YjbR family DNA-binding protein [Blautia sp.]
MQNTYQHDVIRYIASRYGGEAERPWVRAPAYTVFRHKDNNRIYGILTSVPLSKLGGRGDTSIDIITLKAGDALLRDMLIAQDGVYPGLGFGQRSWITVLLDGTVPFDDIKFFIDRSFSITATAKTRKAISGGVQHE